MTEPRRPGAAVQEEVDARRAGLSQREGKLSAGKRALLDKWLTKGDVAPPRPAVQPIPRRTQDGPVRLSFAQERLWLLDRLEPGSVAYNLPSLVRFQGRLDVPALAAALRQIARRHEVLRTTFRLIDGEPHQVVAPVGELPLPVVDLGALDEAARLTEARRLGGVQARTPFDLEHGPLIRALLVRLAGQDHVLLATMHHIASDGWSMGIFSREVAALYDAFSRGLPSPLPEPAIQYADYAVWQRERQAGGALEKDLASWRQRLAGLPGLLELPTDRPRPPVQSSRGEARSMTLPAGLSRRVELLARAQGATLFMTTLAAFQALLARSSGREDIPVGTPTAGRTRRETEDLIGFFVNTLVIRGDLSGDPTFADLVSRTRDRVVEAQHHQEVPFEKLVEVLRPERSTSHSPLFQVMFDFEAARPAPPAGAPSRPQGGPQGGSGLRVVPMEGARSGTTKFDLTLTLGGDGRGLNALLQYSTDLYDGTTAERLLRHLTALLEAGVAEPGRSLFGLPLLGEAERAQLLAEWNDTDAAPAPFATFPEAFAARARQSPEAVAASFDGVSLSFRELGRRAGALARHLRRLGVGPDVRVGLCAERSLDMIVGIVGILQAGGAYVPLDPAYPAERLAWTLDDAAAPVLVTQEHLAGGLAVPSQVVLLDRLPEREEPEGPAVDPGLGPDHAAYVIYTSGSTGRPKGVVVRHGSLMHLAAALRTGVYGDAGHSLRVGINASFAFDGSVKQIVQIIEGHALCPIPEDVRLDPPAFVELVRRERIEVLDATPSQLEPLLEAGLGAEGFPRMVLVGGEAVGLELWRRGRASRIRFVNVYGPTECTVDATSCDFTAAAAPAVIGRALPNVRTYVVDRSGEPAPAGVPGELWIGGAGVARGYLGRPALTAEKFIPDSFGGVAGARLYRTGDLVRRLVDGQIEFRGRLDHQVKIRGFRIELGEIEAALSVLPGVREAVAMARQDAPGQPRLVAYIVPENGSLSASGLREALRGRLPEYMVPSAFVTLEALPLTPNRKVDRKALPAPDAAELAEAFVAPRTPTEEIVAAVYASVLGVERVGAAGHFFELGGHSLLATRVISRLREALQVELPLRSLFEEPRVAGLAARVDRELRAGAGLLMPPILPVPREGALPLSFAQQRLWFIDQLQPGSPLYNIPLALRVAGPLDVAVLSRVLTEVVRRHEALRTVFVETGGSPAQVIRPADPLRVPVVDLAGLVAERREAEAVALATAEASRPFDLQRGPLLRAALLRLGAQDHAALVTMHHIVSDGWSLGVLTREVTTLYAAFAEGRPSSMPELPVQYADFAAWQRSWLAGDVLQGELAWWKRKLAGAPALLELPTDRPRPAVQTHRGSARPLRLPRELTTRLQELARQTGATPFMILLAGFQAGLSRWSGQRGISVGSPIAGRNHLEIEGLIGFFVNTLVLRSELPGDVSFADLLAQVRETSLEAHTHQEVPFEKLVEELAPERSLSRSPLFQVMFVLQNLPADSVEVSDLVLRPWNAGGGSVAKFDLTLALQETGGAFAGTLEHNADLFDGTTVERWAGHLGRLLEAVIVEPSRRLSDLPLLGEGERAQILREWNDTDAAHASVCLHELVAAQARRTPDAVAVSFEGRSLRYADLVDRSDRLARKLRGLGVGPEVRVGLCMERSPELVVGLLGVLQAGGAYVPLDPEYPRERLLLMLEDSRAAILLTQEGLVPSLPETTAPILALDPDLRVLEGDLPDLGVPAVTPDHPVYVLFTSGSTGRPKGVVISHTSIVNHMLWMQVTHPFRESDCVLQKTPISFDASVWELFAPLLVGGRLALAATGEQRDPVRLVERLRSERATVLQVVPTLLQLLIDEPGFAACPDLRRVYSGGEALAPELVERFQELLPGVALINLYGPTEVTIDASSWDFSAGPRRGISIGRPLHNTRLYVVDEALAPVPLGVPGELVIGGRGLARGYADRPELTAPRFVPDPFNETPGERLYRTGDRVRWQPDGTVEFLGRIDHQVKLRGLRIELGEIESALRDLPEVVAALVMVREDVPGDRRLVAYVVPSTESVIVSAFRGSLSGRLPDYMIPSAFLLLQDLPLAPNGKVDRKALPAPDATGEVDAFVAPRTPTEEIVAAVYAGVLGLERVGAVGHFFELGGHSLLATRVISRLRDSLGVELPLRALFEEPRVAGLAARVDRELRAGAGLLAPPIVPVPREDNLPLSFAQQRLWFIDQLQPGSPLYNIPLALRISGPLEVAVLSRVLTEVTRRHEALRTVFAETGGVPVQVIRPAEELRVPVVDLSGLAAELRESVARELTASALSRPFDLGRGPLFRAALLRLGAEDHAALVAMHHIVSDGWSLGVLTREVTTLYAAFAAGRPSSLPELPVQYADFAAWQRSWLSGDVLASELSWWKGQLSGAPALLELPTDRPRPAVQTHRGDARPVHLSRELTARLQVLARQTGATPFMILLAGFQAALSRWSGQRDVTVGSPIAGRNHLEIEGLIGFFVNTLVLRSELPGGASFADLLAQVRETSLEAHTHQEVPFEKLVEELAPERSLSRSPLFQVMFTLQNVPEAEAVEVSGLVLRPWGAGGQPVAKFDLSLTLQEAGGVFVGGMEHNADLFDGTTIERWIGHLSRLLDSAVEEPARRLAELSLLDEAERAQVLVEWNDTAVAHASEVCLHELVAAQARRTPQAVALSFEGRNVSYAELITLSGRLARILRGLGVGPETRVGVCMERSVELLVGLLGVLQAGGAYVPLDPESPRERLLLMLEDARATVLLTQERLAPSLPETTAAVLALDPDLRVLDGAPAALLEACVTPAHLAYVLFTSGSTGRPKGVVVPHAAIAHHMLWMQASHPLGENDCVLQKTPISFDASVWEFYAPLLVGGKLAIAPVGEQRDPARLVERLRAERVTVLQVVPTLLQLLLEQPGFASSPDLRRVYCGGEALPQELVERFQELLPEVELINVYGPTEATIHASSRLLLPAEKVSIGRPIHNARLYVVDEDLAPVVLGASGELLIGGHGLARGYADRPELTAPRFVPDPFSGLPGERLYRTGDRARWQPDGTVEFLGRIDHQVKLRGLRIELGEIESALHDLSEVTAAMVMVREDVPGDRRLVAYVVPAAGGVTVSGLREALGGRLPDYMIPSAFLLLQELPLTPNGKVDRKALPASEAAEEMEVFVAPRTPTEEIVAAVYADVLGLERVGALGHFFELGGHSLLATRVISRLREILRIELSLRSLFEEPRVAGLAARADRELRAGTGLLIPAIVPVPRDGVLPASFAQQRLWLLDQLQPGTPLYNIPLALRVAGPLDVAVLSRVLAEVVRRHEALRTVFVEIGGSPKQVIRPVNDLRVPVVDLSALAAERREALALELAATTASRPFDLARGPLFRAALLRLGAEDHAALVAMHHIVSDGWSLGVLTREVTTLYASFAAGRPSPLPELPVQYVDFAAWQRSWLSGEVLVRELSWWKEKLAGAPALLELPTDRPRPAVQTHRGATRPVLLSRELTARLQALARQTGSTPFMILLAGFQAVLARWSGQHDVTVGSPIAGRNHLETEGLIGFFVNTLVLRSELPTAASFADLLAQVRETSLEAHTHQEVPFEKLVEEVAPERSLSHSPLFQVMFALQNVPEAEAVEVSGLVLRPWLAGGGSVAKFDLTLALQETGGAIAGGLEHNADLFDGSTVERWIGHFGRLLDSAVAEPSRRLSDLPLLGDAEQAQLLVEWNDTRPSGAAASPLRLFAEHVRRHPEAPAVAAGEVVLTYAELDRQSGLQARRLRAQGVRPEVLVGVAIDRSPALVVAVLAVLKAGGAWLPLDSGLPRDRFDHIVGDAGVQVLLTGLDEADGDRETLPELPPAEARPESLAYVIYTSGSTGRPKGVELSHAGLANLVDWHLRTYGLAAGDRTTQVANPAFDASVWEIWPALAAGACLCIPGDEERAAPARLLAWLEAHQISHAFLPTPLAEALLQEEIPPGLPLRWLLTGGDKLHRAPERGLPFRLVNHYGPTEGTVVATAAPVPAGLAAVPSIGRPIAATRVYVVDASLHPAPLGTAGELCIAGTGQARGYRLRPALTAEKFIPDPWSGEPGSRLYRTGDLVRWSPAGDLEFLGRIDHQVKIRGLRIELGEIEAALLEQPGVRDAVVTVREDMPGERLLATYVVAHDRGTGETLSASGLREALRQRLPEPMVPAAWVFLEDLPLTRNGKVDRRALPAPGREGEGSGFVPPRTPTEEIVAGIYVDVLGAERVGALGHFFDLGGHSLLAMQIISRLRDSLGIELPLRALFEEPRVAGLAARVDRELRAGAGLPAPPIVPVLRQGDLPLSFAQQRLWFIDQLQPGSPLYNIPLALRVTSPLDLAVLSRVLTEVVRRHEALRTVFGETDGSPAQVIRPAEELRVPVVDLSGLPQERRESVAQDLTVAEASRSFDLQRGPLFRAALLRLGTEDHAALVTMHHIVSDGWSLGVLTSEVTALYAAFAACRPSPLPELPVQYADFAAWQRSWLSGDVLAHELSWWKAKLSGAAALLELPTDRPRPAVQTHRGSTRPVLLPRELSARLQALARQTGATPFMILLAGFQAALSRWSGQRDVSVGSPIAGRNHLETEGLIGFFVNTLVLRSRLPAGASFVDLLAQVREMSLEAHTHQEVPFEKLVEELAPERSLSHAPLFQAMFALQNVPEADAVEVSDLVLRPWTAGGGSVAKFDLTLALQETGGAFAGALEHNADLFDGTTIERWIGHFARLLGGAVADPSRRLAELPLLGEGERAQLLVEWNDTDVAHASVCLHELIAVQARSTPDAVAVSCEGRSLRYAELAALSDRLARKLRGLGVGPEVRVGLCMERSPELVVALLGILQAGGAYVPLDPEYPRERLLLMLEDSRAALLLTQERLVSSLPEASAPLLALDPDLRVLEGALPDRGAPAVTPDHPAYVLFTSGSTGRPKGVVISHAAIANHMLWMQATRPFLESDCVLQKTPVSFDASVWELFAPLLTGGRLALAATGEQRDPVRLVERLRSERVTVLQVVPTLLQLLLDEPGFVTCPDLRRVYCGGEALAPELVERFQELLPGVDLINLYGPTEVTIDASSWDFSAGPRRGISIGRPLHNTRLHVVDADLSLVPLGVPGELVIGGRGLARGYADRPELTAPRFIPDPFSDIPGERLYRTGDRVRWQPDGTMEFLGRIDHQVKLRGLRIELGEIESVLRDLAEVAAALVIVREDAPGDQRLVGYVVPAEESVSVSALREALAARLPDYMVPSAFVVLEALPLTPNGKVDRKALPAPELSTATGSASMPPRDEIELRIARIWEELLGVESVGVLDDFFALGGHSLLALRLTAHIRRQLGRELPLSALFQTPTVAGLARRLRTEAAPERRTALVEIQPGRPDQGLAPLFLVHPVGGEVLCYLDLARSLGADRPVYGLRVPDPEPGREPLGQIEEMAAAYIEAIRRLQPAGPWHLAGWSLGGLVAFEMARQLREEGQEIGLLALIDSYLDDGTDGPRQWTLPERIGLFARDLFGLSGRELPLPGGDDPVWGLPPEELLRELHGRARQAGILPDDLELPALRRTFEVFSANLDAMERYAGGPYAGPVLLVRPEAAPAFEAESTAAWRQLAGTLEVAHCPGHHYSLVRLPAAARLAELLGEALERKD